jgi:hypothetical protein
MVIPYKLKIKVLHEHLAGIKREQIAKNNGISTGAESMIIDEFRKDIPDLDKLREIAVQMKATGYGVNDYFRAIRHINHVKGLGLTEEKSEEIIETMYEYSFKNGMTIPQLSDCMLYVINAESEMGISINELPRYIVIKTMEVDTLQNKITFEEKKYRDLLRDYKVREEELDDFIKLKPIHGVLKTTKDQLLLETQRNYELSKENNRLREKLEEKDSIIESLSSENNNSRIIDKGGEYANSDKIEIDNQDERISK